LRSPERIGEGASNRGGDAHWRPRRTVEGNLKYVATIRLGRNLSNGGESFPVQSSPVGIAGQTSETDQPFRLVLKMGRLPNDIERAIHEHRRIARGDGGNRACPPERMVDSRCELEGALEELAVE